jgi:ketosteroid isomerase-like protein
MDAALSDLLRAVGEGFEGDADAAASAFHEDAVLVSAGQPPLHGRDAITGWFQAFGGRRERFSVADVLRDGDRVAVEYAVAFRADAHAYARHGIALLRLRDGSISSWRGVEVEAEEDLSPWGGD